MKYSASECEKVLYKLIVASALASEVNGEIWKGDRPSDSSKEDIVINCLPITSGTTQLASANVNIYVPDTKLDKQWIKDSARITELESIASDILGEVHGPYYMFYVEYQGIISEPDIKQHFINYRLRFQFYEPE